MRWQPLEPNERPTAAWKAKAVAWIAGTHDAAKAKAKELLGLARLSLPENKDGR